MQTETLLEKTRQRETRRSKTSPEDRSVESANGGGRLAGPVVAGEEIAGAEELVDRLEAAVRLGDPQAITSRIQRILEQTLSSGALYLPERFRRPKQDSYARRLLHRDPELDYTAVVMTWGPGQRTPLHDHDGCWCVEGVVEGEIRVTRYELLDGPVAGAKDLFHFRRQETLDASPGEAGSLIPPLEHHVLGNAGENGVALTFHVYQGEMTRCATFEPVAVDGGEGLYRRQVKSLGYDG